MNIYSLANYFPSGIFLENDALIKEIKNLEIDKSINSLLYQNRLDLLSYDCYGNSDLWWILAIYNDIKNPMKFEAKELSIPSITNITTLLSKYIKS